MILIYLFFLLINYSLSSENNTDSDYIFIKIKNITGKFLKISFDKKSFKETTGEDPEEIYCISDYGDNNEKNNSFIQVKKEEEIINNFQSFSFKKKNRPFEKFTFEEVIKKIKEINLPSNINKGNFINTLDEDKKILYLKDIAHILSLIKNYKCNKDCDYKKCSKINKDKKALTSEEIKDLYTLFPVDIFYIYEKKKNINQNCFFLIKNNLEKIRNTICYKLGRKFSYEEYTDELFSFPVNIAPLKKKF